MSIPHFKSNHDWEAFTQIFDSQWHCKKALLDRVKDDMFPGYEWHSITPKSIEVINDIVSNLVYECERQFKETRPEYKTDDDGVLTFPDELIEELGWKEGDVLQWIDNKDGSFSLVKPNEHS